jgi:hypothetical protein
VSRVAKFAVEAQVKTVRCRRFVGVGVADEVADAEFRCRGTYGEGVDRLPAGS